MIEQRGGKGVLGIVDQLIESIPADTRGTELLERLKIVCTYLANLDGLASEIFFREKVQPRFELSAPEASAYLRRIKDIRKEQAVSIRNAEPEFCYSTEFEGLIDVVENEGKSVFLVKNSDGIFMADTIQIDGKILLPPQKTSLPFRLARGTEVMKYWSCYKEKGQENIDRSLYEDLLGYYKQVAELPDAEAYDLLTCWTFHSYVLQHSNFSPILCFYGLAQRGKSRIGQAAIYASFHGVTVETLSPPHIIRITRDLKSSIFLDVTDFVKKAKADRSTDLIMLRFSRGAIVPRVLRPTLGPHRDTEFFPTFGATIVATNENLDQITESRAIVIRMPASRRMFDSEIAPENAQSFKERLTAFRAFHMERPLPVVAKPVIARLGDITRPILQIAMLVHPDAEARLRRFILRIEAERAAEQCESHEGEILRAILAGRSEMQNGRIPVRRIAEILNERKETRQKIDLRSVGWKLRQMGFEKVRTGTSGAAALLWNADLIESLCEEFGISSETSETAVSPVQVRPVSATELLKQKRTGRIT